MKPVKQISELINLDVALKQNPRYTSAMISFLPALASMKQWLASTQETVPTQIQKDYENIISILALFNLPLVTASLSFNDQIHQHPLLVSLQNNYKKTVKTLLRAGAAINNDVLEYLIRDQKIDMLRLVLKEVKILPDLTPILLTNLLNRHTATNEMHKQIISALVPHLSGAIINNIYPPERFSYFRVNADYVYFGPHSGGTPMMFAARNGLIHIVQALLLHPQLDLLFRTPEGNTVLKCAADSRHPPTLALLKQAVLKQFYLQAKNSYSFPYNHPLFSPNISRQELAFYMLTHAQTLPSIPESILHIQEDINALKNPDNCLSIFLAGHLLHRIRNKLIADLHLEITKRENLAQGADQGTSRLYGHLMPGISQPAEEIEMLNLDIDGDTEKNDGFSFS